MNCEGSCEQHSGEVRRIDVWQGAFHWGWFDYCDQAIADNSEMGFSMYDEDGEDAAIAKARGATP